MRGRDEKWLRRVREMFAANEERYARKIFLRVPGGKVRVYHENPLMTFDKLRGDDLLTTDDLQRYFNCSARTLYRWIAEHGLEPAAEIGRELYFEKRDVVRWEKTRRPKRGRPAK